MSSSAHPSCTLARRLARHVRARAGAQDGFTIIEVLVASVVLTIGIDDVEEMKIAVSRVSYERNRKRRAVVVLLRLDDAFREP